MRRAGLRRARRGLAAALLLGLAGCAAPARLYPPGPETAWIAVADRGWHTDLCIAHPPPDDRLAVLGAGFPGASVLCFGFGERQYLLTPDHGLLEELSALFPSRAALLMTALRTPPADAFGAGNVVTLPVTAAAEAGLRRFIWRALSLDAAGRPIRLRDGPYPGSVFWAASATYDAFSTCNTWTADGLRAAGIALGGPIVFSGQVMSQVRQIAARPAR